MSIAKKWVEKAIPIQIQPSSHGPGPARTAVVHISQGGYQPGAALASVIAVVMSSEVFQVCCAESDLQSAPAECHVCQNKIEFFLFLFLISEGKAYFAPRSFGLNPGAQKVRSFFHCFVKTGGQDEGSLKSQFSILKKQYFSHDFDIDLVSSFIGFG